MPKVWGRRSSLNVQKVMWTIGELELAHEHVDAGGSFGGLDTAEFRAMNPNRLVPVLADAGAVIWESQAIVRYLAATYGRGTLWADDPAERSLADRWMDWAQAIWQPDMMGIFWGYWRTPEPQRNLRAIERMQSACATRLEILDAHLAKHAFVAGSAFTMGDIPLGTGFYRYFEMGLPTPEVPNVRAWYARLCQRPAYRAHVMLSFDELKGRLAF
jgi:glutathione S-transferase